MKGDYVIKMMSNLYLYDVFGMGVRLYKVYK